MVYRSLNHFIAQVINDFDGKTIVATSSHDKELRANVKKMKNKKDLSRLIGESMAKKAKKKKISKVVFDRNGYTYHSRVKAFAEAARKGGLEF